MSVPSKLTNYFAAGRPIVLLPRATALRRELAAAGGGLRVEPG